MERIAGLDKDAAPPRLLSGSAGVSEIRFPSITHTHAELSLCYHRYRGHFTSDSSIPISPAGEDSLQLRPKSDPGRGAVAR